LRRFEIEDVEMPYRRRTALRSAGLAAASYASTFADRR